MVIQRPEAVAFRAKRSEIVDPDLQLTNQIPDLQYLTIHVLVSLSLAQMIVLSSTVSSRCERTLEDATKVTQEAHTQVEELGRIAKEFKQLELPNDI